MARLLRALTRARWLVLAALLAGSLNLVLEELPAGGLQPWTPRGMAARRPRRQPVRGEPQRRADAALEAPDESQGAGMLLTGEGDSARDGADGDLVDAAAAEDAEDEGPRGGGGEAEEEEGVETEEGERGGGGGGEGAEAEALPRGQQPPSWFELMREQATPHKGRDQSKFAFDRDEVPDPGVLNHLVWEEQVPILLHQGCHAPEPRVRDDGMEWFSNVFIPDEPRLGGFPAGGCGSQLHEPEFAGLAKPPGMQKLTFRISGPAYSALPEADMKQRLRRHRWRTCAVVGNSGVMLAKAHGAAIDKHDMVLRMNNAPLGKQWAASVGTKTTISLVNQHHGKMLAGHMGIGGASFKHGKDAILLMYESGHPAVRNQILRNLRQRYRRAQLLSPAFLVRAYATWFKLKAVLEEERFQASGSRNATTFKEMKRKPMSGFFAALFAAQVCQQVSLYGFAPWTKGSFHPYHYFDRVSGTTAVHSFSLAFKVFRLMAKHLDMTVVQ
eukprot:jgi/Tetstr1/438684/TSEL_027234.t1